MRLTDGFSYLACLHRHSNRHDCNRLRQRHRCNQKSFSSTSVFSCWNKNGRILTYVAPFQYLFPKRYCCLPFAHPEALFDVVSTYPSGHQSWKREIIVWNKKQTNKLRLDRHVFQTMDTCQTHHLGRHWNKSTITSIIHVTAYIKAYALKCEKMHSKNPGGRSWWRPSHIRLYMDDKPGFPSR